MKISFLGTAASEGWPSLFCQCEACKRARSAGGRNIRTRQQVLLNDDLLLDFGPDTLMHVNQQMIDLSRIHDVLVTHAHSDHFYPEDMMKITCNYTPVIDDRLLNVYGNEDVVRAGNDAHEMKNRWKGCDSIHFELLKALSGMRSLKDIRCWYCRLSTTDLRTVIYTISGLKTVLYCMPVTAGISVKRRSKLSAV